MMGTSSPIDSEASKGTKKKWTPLEDEALISSMVDLFKSGTHNGLTGFKSGYLKELEELLKTKVPNSGIKARPHIESRLKTLKKDWGTLFDMVYGPHSNKFRWDYKRNVVVGKNEDWDAYLMTHKDATPFRFRSFPYFEELTMMYAKERTMVNGNRPTNQAVEDDEASSVGPDSPCDIQGSKGNKRKWNPIEDEALVSCMVDLFKFFHPDGDGGFKSGYLWELERMLHEKLPNCGLKAKPHIESRLKTLKKDWSILYEMIYGPHGSGFKWDSTKKMATAENSFWDAYLHNHKEAAPFRFRAFPHFEDLSFIYAKDRAIGQHSRAVKDILQDLDLASNDVKNRNENGNAQANQVHEDRDPLYITLNGDDVTNGRRPTYEDKDSPDGGPNEDNFSEPEPLNVYSGGNKDPPVVLPNGHYTTRPVVGESKSSARKRKRLHKQEEIPVLEAERNPTHFQVKQSGPGSLRQQIEEFNDAMEMVEGLEVDERLLASIKIVERPAQMFLFLSLKPELRLRWVKMFLSNN